MNESSRLKPLPPIGLSNRLRRIIWGVGCLLFYRPTPVPAHAWRRFILRCFGANIEGKVHPYPTAKIWAPWNLTMREGSCIAGDVDCYNVAPVEICSRAVVSQKTYLCTASHDFDSLDFRLTGGAIVIGRDAWVAADAFVGPGVTVGSRAVVLACAVIVRDVAPGAIVGGNPAKLVRERALPTSR